MLIGVGGFWCPDDAGPVSSGRNWTEIPGNYKLKVEVSHEMRADELERVGPALEGARDWTLRSNAVGSLAGHRTRLASLAMNRATEALPANGYYAHCVYPG